MTKEKTWRTQDGKEIPISQMDDGHLINTIHYLEKKAETRLQDIKAVCKALIRILKNKGEEMYAKAIYELTLFMENEQDQVTVSDLFSMYDDMIEEVHRRGLEEQLIASLLGKEDEAFDDPTAKKQYHVMPGHGRSICRYAADYTGVEMDDMIRKLVHLDKVVQRDLDAGYKEKEVKKKKEEDMQKIFAALKHKQWNYGK